MAWGNAVDGSGVTEKVPAGAPLPARRAWPGRHPGPPRPRPGGTHKLIAEAEIGPGPSPLEYFLVLDVARQGAAVRRTAPVRCSGGQRGPQGLRPAGPHPWPDHADLRRAG